MKFPKSFLVCWAALLLFAMPIKAFSEEDCLKYAPLPPDAPPNQPPLCSVFNFKSGMIPLKDGQFTRVIMPHCERHGHDGSCTKCEPGYVQLGTFCAREQPFFTPNCQHYHSEKICYRCRLGFVLTFAGNCMPLNPTDTCGLREGKDCIWCLPDSVLIRGQCVKTSPNCALSTSYTCQACSTGFYMQPTDLYKANPLRFINDIFAYNYSSSIAGEFKCVAETDADCLARNLAGECEVCIASKVPTTANGAVTCAAEALVAGCAVNSKDNNCIVCSEGKW